MGRQLKDSRIESREARIKLKQSHEPYWRLIHPGYHIGYRKGSKSGSWILRRLISDSKYSKEVIGVADDTADSDGKVILSYKEAIQKANSIIDSGQPNTKKITIANASEHYLEWFKQNRKTYKETLSTIETHILPDLGARLINELKTNDIKKWHQKLAERPKRKRTSKSNPQSFSNKPQTEDEKRARRNTANRILTVLKAILNKAFQDELVHSDLVWKRIKPFPNVDEPVIRFLTDYEAIRLLNACQGSFRDLVHGGLKTGCRYGELGRLTVANVSLERKNIYVRASKNSKSRHIPLNDEGLELFKKLTVGKIGKDLVFTKDDGTAWGKNHHTRLLITANEIAKIDPIITFHDLRHTYASSLAQGGADLLIISKLLGHADTRITARHYAHLCDRTLANAVNNLLPNFKNTALSDVHLKSIAIY